MIKRFKEIPADVRLSLERKRQSSMPDGAFPIDMYMRRHHPLFYNVDVRLAVARSGITPKEQKILEGNSRGIFGIAEFMQFVQEHQEIPFTTGYALGIDNKFGGVYRV